MNTLKKQLLVISTILICMTSFAQKEEMKQAGKAIAKSNFVDALASLTKVEGMLGSLDDKTKSKFYFLKSKALNGSGKLMEAAATINQLLDLEKTLGKLKYTKDVKPMLHALTVKLQTIGRDQYSSENFKLAKVTLAQVHDLNPLDTAFLFYAASAAQRDKDLDLS
jgi:hypothetical protein